MGYKQKILPLRSQSHIKDARLISRLENLLPDLMQETGIDMWIVTSQESNEDPVMKTMLPSPMLTSGRRTILVYYLKDDKTVELISISKPGFAPAKFYNSVWVSQKGQDWGQFAKLSPDKGITQGNVGEPETQMECLKRIIDERSPKNIGLNYCQTTAFGDGISHGTFELICEGIGEDNAAKIVSAADLCVRWLETRLPDEIEALRGVVALGADILHEALSTNVIHPGITTAADLEWWAMQRCTDLGLRPWFPYMAALRRKGAVGLSGDVIILEGDIIHFDIGFEYLGLCCDLQNNAYVLRRGETEAPQGINDLFEKGKRFQDIAMGEIKLGRTGNEILKSSLGLAKKEGLDAMIYSHPLGTHGHAAGPSIGGVDNQKFLEGNGERRINDNTCYALELNVSGPIPEWDGQSLMLGIETDIVFSGGVTEFLYRQDTLILV